MIEIQGNMVYGCMIQSLDISKSFTYFSQFYTPEGNDEFKNQRQQVIVGKLLEEYAFRKACNEGNPTQNHQQMGSVKDLSSADYLYKLSEEGSFRIFNHEISKKGTPLFHSALFIVWKQIAK